MFNSTIRRARVGAKSIAAAVVFAGIAASVLLSGCTDADGGSIEGPWAGVLQSAYYCEGGAYTIELSISGSTVTITGGTIMGVESPFPEGTTGTIEQQAGQTQAYTVSLENQGSVPGYMLFDALRNYALFITYESPYDPQGFTPVLGGVLQKGALVDVTYEESDLLGDWAGLAVRINNDFEVTESSESTATISELTIRQEPAVLALAGTDGDGEFSARAPGIAIDPGSGSSTGIYVSGDAQTSFVSWSRVETYAALYALSFDKSVLAVAFLKESGGGLCYYELDDELSGQKFAVWAKQ